MHASDATPRRQYPRLHAPVFFRLARFRSTRYPVVNVGLGGLSVYSDEPLKVGERLDVELLLSEENVFDCLVRVAWVSALENGPAPYDIGLELLDIRRGELAGLLSLLENDQGTRD